jgi:hypothetical protein
MAGQARPILKVYNAFYKAGRDKEAGTVKEAFLEALKAQGVDFTKTSVARLARFLRGTLSIEELEHPMKGPFQIKRPKPAGKRKPVPTELPKIEPAPLPRPLVKLKFVNGALSATERRRLEIVFEVETANELIKFYHR